jgi:hypothetical protein
VFRRFLIAVLIFLLAVLVAADRLGAIVAAHVLAGKVQNDEHLAHRPAASIGGIPFLTQALAGKYNDVTIKAADVVVSGVTVTMVTAHLYGVHIPLKAALRDRVAQVPVNRVAGSAFVSFDDVNTYLSAHHPAGQAISLRSGQGNSATIMDKLRVAGKTFSLRGVGTLTLSDNVVTIGVSHLLGAAAGKTVSAKVLSDAQKALRISIPLQDLPFRIKLNSVTISVAGITATGGALNTVLGGGRG